MDAKAGTAPEGHRVAHSSDPVSKEVEDEDQHWRMSSDLYMCAVPNGHPQLDTHRSVAMARQVREILLRRNSL